MRNLRSALLVLSLLLLSAGAARANAPAPWWACEGKQAGAACEQYGGGDGICAAQEGCTDDAETAVDECLYCESDDEDGGGCSAAGGAAGGGGMLLALAAFAVRRRRG